MPMLARNVAIKDITRAIPPSFAMSLAPVLMLSLLTDADDLTIDIIPP